MKTSLWIVIVVVVGIVGFLFGYSVPSFLHVGSAASEVQKKAAPAPAIDKSTDEYYKHLLEE